MSEKRLQDKGQNTGRKDAGASGRGAEHLPKDAELEKYSRYSRYAKGEPPQSRYERSQFERSRQAEQRAEDAAVSPEGSRWKRGILIAGIAITLIAAALAAMYLLDPDTFRVVFFVILVSRFFLLRQK